MKRSIFLLAAGLALCFWPGGDVSGRGFGGFRGGYGGFSGGGLHYGSSSFRGSYSGYHSGSGYSYGRSGGYSGSYDRSYDTARGGSVSTSGARRAAYRPVALAAGGT